MNLIAAFVLACNVHYIKFKTPEMTEHLAWVKCYKDMDACYKWNQSVEYCTTLLEEL